MNIQAVRQKDTVIAEVRRAEFWQVLSMERLEWVRTELRGIMKYRQTGDSVSYGTPTTKTKDGGVQEVERVVKIVGANEALLYRRRLKTVLDGMIADNPLLQKIRKGEAIATAELQMLTSTILTSHPGVSLDVLNEFYGRTAEQLQDTLRELVGLDVQAVEQHFTTFLHQHPTLTAQQVRFMNLLKNYIAEHGSIPVDTLYDAPFTSVDYRGIDGVFSEADAGELFAVLQPFLRKKPSPQPLSQR